jgi:sugar lactone lactonase YvrE
MPLQNVTIYIYKIRKIQNKNWRKLANYFLFNSYLYIAKTSDSTIVRYDPSTGNVINLMTGGAGQSITLDQYNDVIYWVNYDRSSHRVMRTLFTGQTSDLNITYSDPIILTSDVLHLYVLDTENNRIDKISKESLEVQSNFTYSGEIHDIIVAYGEFSNFHGVIMSSVCLKFRNYEIPP